MYNGKMNESIDVIFKIYKFPGFFSQILKEGLTIFFWSF